MSPASPLALADGLPGSEVRESAGLGGWRVGVRERRRLWQVRGVGTVREPVAVASPLKTGGPRLE